MSSPGKTATLRQYLWVGILLSDHTMSVFPVRQIKSLYRHVAAVQYMLCKNELLLFCYCSSVVISLISTFSHSVTVQVNEKGHPSQDSHFV